MEKSNNKITTMDELKKIAPELSKIKKENPFRVPENYFEDFSVRLQERLETEKKGVPVKQSRVIQFLKPAIGLAAGFALIFTLSYWPLQIFTPNEQANNLNNINSESEMLYATWVEGIDENSFYAMLDNPNGTVNFTEDDLADFVSTNSSEYDIFSETEK